MTQVVDEIAEWSKGRPVWQQDALRRLATAGQVSDEAIDTYVRACLGDRDAELTPLERDHLGGATSDDTRVTIAAVRNVEHVNSLVPGELLTFSDSGLTIVYGDNGSGKSGYARVLKSVTRTRAHEAVRNDVFADGDLVPRATIDYVVDDEARSFAWIAGAESPGALLHPSFFDHACADVYLSRETEVAFRPSGLGLFDELVAVCERVRSRLDSAKAEAVRPVPGLPDLEESTTAASFLAGLAADTRDEEIDEACTFTPEARGRLEELEAVLVATQGGTGAREADHLSRLSARARRSRTALARIGESASEATRDSIGRLHREVSATQEAADAARTQVLGEGELEGIGEPAWRALWEAARAFSQESAYRDRDFPAVVDARCVLCQQPLDADAATRLTAFDEFVRDATQRAAESARLEYEAAVASLDAVETVDQATVDLASDLTVEDREAGEVVSAYISAVDEALSELRSAVLNDSVDLGGLTFPVPPLERLDACIEALDNRAAEIRSTLEPGKDDSVRSELSELNATEALSAAKEMVVKERDRLQRLQAIAGARSETSTNAITHKSAEMTNAVLTDVLMDRFSRETDRLGLENVVLRTIGGRRGVLRYKAGFVGATQEAPLPEVLSEGEQTALGMAGFLAEVWTDPGKSAVVFDDPVTSLDHQRRDKVAERLVALAKERQTIVFTHDVAFLLALKKHAVAESVGVTERCVERRQSKPGHCGGFHRFSAKLVKERLNELAQGVEELRAAEPEMSVEEYRDATAKWYRRLRQTWERAIEETLVGDILTRGDLQVHPTMARTLVLYTAEDNKALQHRYGRATELSEAHDESSVINAPAPSLTDMEEDLEAIREWHKRVAGRRSLSEEKIYGTDAGG
jgi:energy-coupling factor transporter ATP-binding protein EcfA2